MLKTINKLVEEIQKRYYVATTKYYMRWAIVKASIDWYDDFDELRSSYRNCYTVELIAKHLGEDKVSQLACRAKICTLNRLLNIGGYTHDMQLSDIASAEREFEAGLN